MLRISCNGIQAETFAQHFPNNTTHADALIGYYALYEIVRTHARSSVSCASNKSDCTRQTTRFLRRERNFIRSHIVIESHTFHDFSTFNILHLQDKILLQQSQVEITK